MKKIIFITILLGVGYSQCNESNWEEYYPDMSGCDLQGAYLEGVNLSGANLEDAILSEADLTGANLIDANLSGAYFYLTNLTNTIWDECGITDDNADGYDDASYDAGAESGDLNLDGVDNIQDVIILVDNILNP